MADAKTTPMADHDAFEQAFAAACGECIRAARRLRPRLLQADLLAASEFGQIAGTAMGRSGATADEAVSYMQRILASVLAEPQA